MKYSCPLVLDLADRIQIVSVQQYTANIRLVSCDTQSGCPSAVLECPAVLGDFQLVVENGLLNLVAQDFTLTGPIDDNGNFVIISHESRNGTGCLEDVVSTLTGHFDGNSISGVIVTQINEADDGPSGTCATNTCPDQYVDNATFTGEPV